MSVTISASGYDSRFIFEGATAKGGDTPAASAPAAATPASTATSAATTPTVAVARSASLSQLASSLDMAGLTRGGAAVGDAAQAGGSVTLASLGDEAKTKLTDAMSTLLDALAGAAGQPKGSTVQDAIKTVVSTLGPIAATASPSVATGSAGTTSSSRADNGAVKPNLDVLNRVLSHYAAQSAASESMLSLVS